MLDVFLDMPIFGLSFATNAATQLGDVVRGAICYRSAKKDTWLCVIYGGLCCPVWLPKQAKQEIMYYPQSHAGTKAIKNKFHTA